MTTETTTSLPPCPLPGCEGGEHHYHDIDTYTIDTYTIAEEHDCARAASIGYRCYSQHRPQSPQWQPIEHDQIKAGMRIRATVAWDDRITTHAGVAHHTNKYGDWLTEDDWRLTGWNNSATYEVDPATIPDPDADLIETVAETLHRTNWPTDMWDGLSVEAYRELARAALTAIRESEATA